MALKRAILLVFLMLCIFISGCTDDEKKGENDDKIQGGSSDTDGIVTDSYDD